MDIDISEKVKFGIKYGFVSLLGIAFLCSAAVWFYQRNHSFFAVATAQINSNLVGTRTKASGTVTEILVQDGQHVEAGEVVAKVKVNVTEEEIKQLEQNLELAQKNLETIKEGTMVTRPVVSGGSTGASQGEIEGARAQMERMENLYSIGAVSAAQRDQARSAYYAVANSAGSSSVSYESSVQAASPEMIKSAELQVQQAQAALEGAKQNAAATEIVAPVAGTVYLTDVKADSEVQAGQVIVNIGDASAIWLEASVDPIYQDRLALGQYAEYTVDDKSLQGTVTDIIEPTANDDSLKNTEGSGAAWQHKDGRILVKVSVPAEMVSALRPGMKARVKFFQ